ncbi:PiggyBac transposable element-derived protein 4, partial [Stegodyphus mimosarum]
MEIFPLSKRSHHADWKDVTAAELFLFLAVALLWRHVEKDSISDYWSTNELIETQFFRKIISLDRFKKILRFLHFANNETPPSK